MDWIKASADTVVSCAKDVRLRDVVQLVLDGLTEPEDVMRELDMTESDDGASSIPEILSIFVPVVNAWESGVCKGGCSGCSGGCCGE